MTPKNQRTILFRKAIYAMAKKKRNAAALSGKILISLKKFSKFSVPSITT